MKYPYGTSYRSTYLKRVSLSAALAIMLSMGNASRAGTEDHEALATFDFAIAETLNAIGHPPTFLAGLKGYETYSRQVGIIPSSINLGYRHLPNLELLASEPPQHILISPPAHVNLVPKLREISDVQEYPIYDFSDTKSDHNYWEILENLTRELGDLVNEPEATEHYIDRINNHFDKLKSRLKDIDYPLLLVRLMDERHAQVFARGNVQGMVLKRLGLKNAWQGEVGRWGFTTVDASSLLRINAKLVFLGTPYDPAGGQKKLLHDGLWKHWPSVQQGNYTILSVNFWSWGGLPAAQRFADSLTNQLIENDADTQASSSTSG